MLSTERDPIRILVVCTANICRSPMAEAMLRKACADVGVPADVSSAGFLFEGQPASDTAVKVMGEIGLDVRSHRSRIIDAAIVAESDLVLTMERRHARDIVLSFESLPRVHTLRSFAAAASQLSQDDVGDTASWTRSEFIDAINARRDPTNLLGDQRPDEVPDPHGRSARVHRKTRDALAEAVDAIAAAFAASNAE